jgi:hypothetical protein
LRKNASALVLELGSFQEPPHPQSLTVGPGWPPKRDPLRTESLQISSFPLLPGVVSMHVRHGDKASEMTLATNEAYFSAAESLVLLNPLGLKRAAFISTEDPVTIEAARKESRGWDMMWYDMPRSSTAGINPGLQTLPLPRAKLIRIVLMQLLMALECDAWVGTRESNWNRLIDELRCIWVPKCKQPFVEVGVYGTHNVSFGW